jgi:outer membrane lipoprotein-sorting protein
MRAVLLLGLLSCAKSPLTAVAGPSLVAQMKQRVAERDKRLTSFQIAVDSKQGAQLVHHEFYFKAPNHSRGVLLTAPLVTLSFDGHYFYRLLRDTKQHEKIEFKLPAEQTASFLASTFQPFAPEGFRAPLIPASKVVATHTSHPLENDAVALKATLEDGMGTLEMTWILRERNGDFLEKRSGDSSLLVKEESCDDSLKLCVPTTVVQFERGAEVGRTVVTFLQLNPALSSDSFSLVVPAGFQSTQREMLTLP